MSDLTNITVTGPFQAQFDSIPEIDQPPECQVPDAIPGTLSLTPIDAPVIPMDCTFNVGVVPFIPDAMPNVTSTDVHQCAFAAYVSDSALHKIKIDTGKLYFNGQHITVTNPNVEFTLPITADGTSIANTYIGWIEWNNVANTFTIMASLGGWTNYPAQPVEFFKYYEIFAMTTAGYTPTSIQQECCNIRWPTPIVPAEPCPFDVIYDSTTGDAYVWPGTINNLVPTNILTVFNVASTINAILTVNTDGVSVTSASVGFTGTDPSVQAAELGAAPAIFEILLAKIVGGRVFKSLKCGNLMASPDHVMDKEKATPPNNGGSLYDKYYQWKYDVF